MFITLKLRVNAKVDRRQSATPLTNDNYFEQSVPKVSFCSERIKALGTKGMV
jgi:hypothetical protein